LSVITPVTYNPHMHLVIQIPCLNEAETLPAVIGDIPATLPGIEQISVLVIDDGSTDGTADVAQAHGVNVVRHPRNLGLAQAFQTGLETALRLGADIIVNTDADNQYPGDHIGDLVAPVRDGSAEIVIGDRQIEQIEHFSALKKMLQRIGSRVVRSVSGTDVPDTVSGFRAYSRQAALRLNVLTQFSYTLDTLIQAGKQGMTITSVPIATNSPTRPSRLQRSTWHFVRNQAATILRLYAFYEPLRTFALLSLPFWLLGAGFVGRFIVRYLTTSGEGLIQSVTIGTGLCLAGLITLLFGLQADIAAKHRRITEETLYRLKKIDFAVNLSEGTEVTDGSA
jgi:glycosyltransferase involved in cell wall biosynthesis